MIRKALVGLFSPEAMEKLKQVFSTILAPAQRGKDHLSAGHMHGMAPQGAAVAVAAGAGPAPEGAAVPVAGSIEPQAG